MDFLPVLVNVSHKCFTAFTSCRSRPFWHSIGSTTAWEHLPGHCNVGVFKSEKTLPQSERELGISESQLQLLPRGKAWRLSLQWGETLKYEKLQLYLMPTSTISFCDVFNLKDRNTTGTGTFRASSWWECVLGWAQLVFWSVLTPVILLKSSPCNSYTHSWIIGYQQAFITCLSFKISASRNLKMLWNL